MTTGAAADSLPSNPAIRGPVSVHPDGGSSSGSPRLPFDQTATAVLGNLQHALADLLAAAPVEIRKSTDVERVFGIHHLLGWKTFRVTSAKNPLAAGAHVPPKASMETLLASAARLNIPQPVIARVYETFEAFERLVDSNAGDRDELQAMLNAFLPEERAKQNLASKELIFKGMSQVKGVANEADVSTFIYAPSATPGVADVVSLVGEFGLRRMRSDARIVLGTGTLNAPENAVRRLDGRPSTDPFGTILPQFSTSPLPPFEIQQVEGVVYYFVAGTDVGMQSAVDLVSADLQTGGRTTWSEGCPTMCGPTDAIDTPVKRLTMDVFMHRDLFPGVTPTLTVYDTAVRGRVQKFGDPTRAHDRLNIQESIRALPPGVHGATLPHIPRYLEMLEHIYASVGWDPSLFRGYRLDVEYPVYAAQYLIGFKLPGSPD